MDDRSWLDDRALGVLDGDTYRKDQGLALTPAWDDWDAAGRPLLSARGRAIAEAVEKTATTCGAWPVDSGKMACRICTMLPVCRAYLGTAASDAKPCPQSSRGECSGTRDGRPCPDGPGPGCAANDAPAASTTAVSYAVADEARK